MSAESKRKHGSVGKRSGKVSPSGYESPGNPSTFLTAIKLKKANSDDEDDAISKDKVSQVYAQLNSTIADLDIKINKVLAKQDYEYLKAYSFYIKRKENEIKQLQEKFNEVDPDKGVKDEKIAFLQGQLEHCRIQVEKMDKKMEENKKLTKKWKIRAEHLLSDKTQQERQMKEYLRQNRMLRLILTKIEKELESTGIEKLLGLTQRGTTSTALPIEPSAPRSFNPDTTRSFRSGGLTGTQSQNTSTMIAPHRKIMAILKQAEDFLGNAGTEEDALKMLEELVDDNQHNTSTTVADNIGTGLIHNLDGSFVLKKPIIKKYTKSDMYKNIKISTFVDELFQEQISDYEKQEILITYMTDLEQGYANTVSQSKSLLNKEKQKVQRLKSIKPNEFVKKSEYEALFLDCVEESKKFIMKRKLQTALNTGKGFKQVPKNEPELKGLEHTLIKLADFAKHKIKIEEFTINDKYNLLTQFVSNDKMLLKMYELIFPHRVSERTTGMTPIMKGSVSYNLNQIGQLDTSLTTNQTISDTADPANNNIEITNKAPIRESGRLYNYKTTGRRESGHRESIPTSEQESGHRMLPKLPPFPAESDYRTNISFGMDQQLSAKRVPQPSIPEPNSQMHPIYAGARKTTGNYKKLGYQKRSKSLDPRKYNSHFNATTPPSYGAQGGRVTEDAKYVSLHKGNVIGMGVRKTITPLNLGNPPK